MTEAEAKLLRKGDKIELNKGIGVKPKIYTLNQFEIKTHKTEIKLLWNEEGSTDDAIWDFAANLSSIVLVERFKSFKPFKDYLKQKV